MFTFDRALPEETGITSESIKRILIDLDKKEIPMHSLLIMKDEKLIFEKYYAPYKADTLHRLFSISKSITSLAISLLIDDGQIGIDDPITLYFPEYIGETTHPWIKATTIRNMLEMRTCHAACTYKVDMTSNWVESFFKVKPTNKPGTIFHYDTSAAHVLCALVEKLTGMELLTFLKEKVLKYMDFSAESYMVKDPFGVSIGGSGLVATPMDFLKILYLYEKRGTITCNDGIVRNLLSKEFLNLATSNISDTVMNAPIPSEAQGYGMQVWQNEKGGYVLYGMGGQLGISIPDENLLIVTTADTQGIAGGNQVIYDTLYRHLIQKECSYPDDKSTPNELSLFASSFEIAMPRLPESRAKELVSVRDDLIGTTLSYSLKDNDSSFKSLNLFLTKDGVSTLSLSNEERDYKINFGLTKMQQGIFPKYNTPYTAGAIFLRENVLYIKVHLIGESVGSIRFELYFGDDDITVFMKKIEETYFNEFSGHLYGYCT